MRTSKPDDSVLTIEELAVYLKLPRSTAYKLAQEGALPGTKVGRHWRFSRVAVDKWLTGKISSRQRGKTTGKTR